MAARLRTCSSTCAGSKLSTWWQYCSRPISRITLVPFSMVAPFMIGIIYFAAYQVTRSWYDLIALFVLGVLGVYMKRFGWSPPALLIGFVLSTRLDAAVYQSVQVYGMSFLERTGVQVMLALIAVSVFLAVRFKRAREPLTSERLRVDVSHSTSASEPTSRFRKSESVRCGFRTPRMVCRLPPPRSASTATTRRPRRAKAGHNRGRPNGCPPLRAGPDREAPSVTLPHPWPANASP